MTIPFRMLNVFIGYDEREVVAYHVLCHSILSRASVPVKFFPIRKEMITENYHRADDGLASTAFSYSRFLTPFYSGFEGWSLYLDCDMLFTVDIAQLLPFQRDDVAVSVVQHDYVPKSAEKFFGQSQRVYPRKNWSSVMLFNNARCKQLTPEIVNSETGMFLHQMKWIGDDEIGELPVEWNFLVGEYAPPEDLPKNIHFTLGGPYIEEYKNCPYADLWFAERDRLMHVDRC